MDGKHSRSEEGSEPGSALTETADDLGSGQAQQAGDLPGGEPGGHGAQDPGMLLVHAGELLEQVNLQFGRRGRCHGFVPIGEGTKPLPLIGVKVWRGTLTGAPHWRRG